MSQALDRITEELETMLRTKLRREIRDHLTSNRQPQGSRDIAAALNVKHHPVQREICELVATGQLAQVCRGANGWPLYRPVEIGPCEWCGLVSHHLVAGECPACRPLTQGQARPSLARLVC